MLKSCIYYNRTLWLVCLALTLQTVSESNRNRTLHRFKVVSLQCQSQSLFEPNPMRYAWGLLNSLWLDQLYNIMMSSFNVFFQRLAHHWLPALLFVHMQLLSFLWSSNEDRTHFQPTEWGYLWKVRACWSVVTFQRSFKGLFEGKDLVLSFRLEF